MSIGPALERSMKITVFADLACPWSYVSTLELRTALAACADLGVAFDIEYRPFWVESLDVLPEGTWMERAELCERKTGMRDVQRRFRACAQRARQLGVEMQLEGSVAQPINAQRLLLHAYRRGGQVVQQELLQAILRNCYEKGRCCDDLEMLADCAQAVDLMPRESALSFLRCSELRGDIVDDVKEARNLGISASPCTIIGGKWAVHGAQGAEVYTRILQHFIKYGHDSQPVSYPLYPALA